MTSYAHPADPLADYIDHHHRPQVLALEAARRRDAALVEAIRVRLAPPFRPAVRVLTSADYPGRLRIVIGPDSGFVTADVDQSEAYRSPEDVAEALLKAGRRALERVGIEPEAHIERGAE